MRVTKQAAPESPQVLSRRKKLKDKFVEEGKMITPQALKNEARLIEHWIKRHDPERVDLKKNTVTLFDENRHSEQPHIRYIEHLALAIKGIPGKSKPSKSLKGRITNP